jgi:hypothetical protein
VTFAGAERDASDQELALAQFADPALPLTEEFLDPTTAECIEHMFECQWGK